MRKKNITISDIAAKTGYSKTTVSFAFNWPNRISAAAVEKIMACAKELGYHGSGEQDSTNRYKTICILVPETVEFGVVPYWARSVYEIYRLCANRGFMMSLICQTRMDDQFFVKTSAVDAFVAFTSEFSNLLVETARKRGIPVIGININADMPEARRSANSVACLNYLINLILDDKVSEELSSDSYLFLENNR